MQVEHVKQRCLPNALNYPMLEEYDFRIDSVSVQICCIASLCEFCMMSKDCSLLLGFQNFHQGEDYVLLHFMSRKKRGL